MKSSICIPTWNKAPYLDKTLASIFRQSPPFVCEIIVVNDGSTDQTSQVLAKYLGPLYPHVKIIELPRKDHFRDCSTPLNLAFRAARGDILIVQSDDHIHEGNVIESVAAAMQPGTYLNIAVRHSDPPGDWIQHSEHKRSYLPNVSAFYRSDIYRIGGYDERFADGVWYSDIWFMECLATTCGLKTIWRDDIVAIHQDHNSGHRLALNGASNRNADMLTELRNIGIHQTPTAPWQMEFYHERD